MYDMISFSLRFSVCKMFLRLQIIEITEICKPTGTNVFVNLKEELYIRKSISCVLEVIFCLETCTNGALNNVLSANFRSCTCIPVKFKINE